MPFLRFPSAMKYYVDNHSEISVSGATVLEAVRSAVEQYPKLKTHVFDSDGNLRRHFNVFVNGEHIRELDGVNTKLEPEDKVILMASASGG